ncbi:MAG TPA: transglutaminase-like domain-containing protein [Gemmataceae bacterium]|nr:transglutaminase-like domain-containing protein [Gemmataceae bacterium]
MRTCFTATLLLVAVALSVSAQPPAGNDPPKIVFKPQRPGGELEPSKAPPVEKRGFIVFSPNGQTPSLATNPQPAPAPASSPAVYAPKTVAPAPVQPPQPAEKKDGTVLFDYWFAAAVEGDRIGYLHWTASEVERNGQKLWHGNKSQKLTVARFGQLASMVGEESTVETANGEVLVTSVRQSIGKDQAMAITGVVEGKTLKVKGEGAAATAESKPWPGGVIGIAREPKLFAQKKFKDGETFDYTTYVAQVNQAVKVTVTFEAEELTALWPNTPPRKLLRFVSRMEPVGQLRLPPATTWCDAESSEPLKVEFDFAGLGGRVTFLRTTKEAAMAPVGRVPDLFNVQSIRLNAEIPGIHARGSVVYKVAMPKDDEPGTTFPSDSRQEMKNLDVKAKTFELHVTGSHGPAKDAKASPAPGKEFLDSNYFLNWDNPEVKGHAAKAAAGLPATAGAWDRAKAVERWVNQNMRAIEFSQAMATADNVAKTLSGDCTEYAMLGASMCRALGVPSRTVLGLVYAPGRDGKPFLAYHMWFEVFAEGQWLPLDATLAHGGIGPGHVKITDHSWHDEKSFVPLLPVLRVLMAKPAFEVVGVK